MGATSRLVLRLTARTTRLSLFASLLIPPISLSPLDIGLFGPLKRAYGKEIETFIEAQINHITKVEFFLAFHTVYKASMTVNNILGGFRGAGLIPLAPEAVLSKLDADANTREVISDQRRSLGLSDATQLD